MASKIRLSKLDFVSKIDDPYPDGYVQNEDGSRETIEAMRDRMQLPPAPQSLISHTLYPVGCEIEVERRRFDQWMTTMGVTGPPPHASHVLYEASCDIDADALRRDFGGPTREECMRKFSETTTWGCSPSPIPVGGTDRCAVCQRTIVLGERYAEIRVIENCFEHVIVCADHRDPQKFARFDPLDALVDGLTLRMLIEIDVERRHDKSPGVLFQRGQSNFTPAQRAAVSAHWSAQLRAKVAASKAVDAARATSVLVQMEID